MKKADIEKAAQVGDELINKLLVAGAEKFYSISASISEVSDYGVLIAIAVKVGGSPYNCNLKLNAIEADDTHYTSNHLDLVVANTIKNIENMLNSYNIVDDSEDNK